MSKKNPKADKAEQLYQQGLKLVDIAAMLDVPDSTVRRWKSTHKWAEPERSGKAERSGDGAINKQIKREAAAEVVKQVSSNEDLSDNDQLFCLYYIKYFNATKAYKKVHPNATHQSASVLGCRVLKRPGVQEEIMRLKQAKMNKALLEPEDIFQKYMDIAFSDITDYVSFGREKNRNVVRFQESDIVDGTLVAEVSQGKDGAKIKLADRMKALDWLADHMDMGTVEQQARVEKLKAETARINGEDPDEEQQDDGFIKALKTEVENIWEDE